MAAKCCGAFAMLALLSGSVWAEADCCDDVLELDVLQQPDHYRGWQPIGKPKHDAYGAKGDGHKSPRGYLHNAEVRYSTDKKGKRVCVKGAFCTISSAINAVRPGGRILVHPGTYNENLIIFKPITIEGAYPPFNLNGGAGLVTDLKGSKVGAAGHVTRIRATDGGAPCVYVDIKKKREGLVRLKNLKIEGNSAGRRIQPCIDVNAHMFSLESSWIVANGSKPFHQLSDDAVIVRSGMAQIVSSQVEGGNTGVRLTSFYDYDPHSKDYQNFRAIFASYVCAAPPFVAYGERHAPSHAPGVVCHGGHIAGVGGDQRFINGKHLLVDNYIANNLIGVEVSGGAQAYVARNRVERNVQSGIVNLDGGGAYTGNDIRLNGAGIRLLFDARGNDVQHSNSNSSYQAVSGWPGGVNRTSDRHWPPAMPIVSGNFLGNNETGIQLLMDPKRSPTNKQSKYMISELGSVYGNCIKHNEEADVEYTEFQHYIRTSAGANLSRKETNRFFDRTNHKTKKRWWRKRGYCRWENF